jgi:hypothetical protein
VFIIAGSLLFTQVGVDTPLWQPMVYMLLLGFGVGNCMQTLTLAAQNAVGFKDMGVSTASATFFRQIGGTLGVAVFLSILFSTVGGKIATALTKALHSGPFTTALHDPAVLHNPVNAPILNILHGGSTGGLLQDASFLQAVDSRLAFPFLSGFASSIDLVFVGVAAIGVVGLVVTLFIKEIPLRTMSGVQAMAAAEGGSELPVTDSTPSLDDELAALNTKELVPAGRHALNGEAQPVPTAVPTVHGAHEAAGMLVSGHVRRADGSPAADAVLTLINHSGQQVARGISAGDGEYRLHAPLDGMYVLIASSTGHQPQASTLRVAGEPVVTDVVLTGTARAVGLVHAEPGPVAGATVTLTDPRGEVVGSVSTAGDGRYVFGDLLGGSYTLVASAAGFRPYATALAVPDSGEIATDILLSGAATLTGTAVGGPDGRPVADARVTLVDAAGTVVAMTRTDDNGAYTFDELPQGEYTVIASGYPPVSGRRTVGAGEDGVHDVVLNHSDI